MADNETTRTKASRICRGGLERMPRSWDSANIGGYDIEGDDSNVEMVAHGAQFLGERLPEDVVEVTEVLVQ